MNRQWREDIILGLIFFLIYLGIGIYLCLVREYMPGDALGRLVSAWLVLNGTEVKLASIGFVWPPIPTLLIIPFAAIPALVKTWIALVIVSASAMAGACVTVSHIASFLGIRDSYRRLIVILFGLNPLMVVFGCNGMSEAILVLCLLLACYFMIRLWKTDRNTDLIFTGGFFGLLPLIRYEFVMVSLWSGVLIGILTWRNWRKFSAIEFRNYLEGRLLAYGSMAIYPLFLWAIACWMVMGNPLYFLVNDRSAVSLTEWQLSTLTGLITTPAASFNLVFGAWVFIFWAGLAALVAVIILGLVQKFSAFLIGMVGMWFVIPILQTIMLIQRTNVPLLRYFIMSIPIGLVLILITLSEIIPALKNRRWSVHLAYVITIILLLISTYGSFQQLTTYPYQTTEGETWKAMNNQETPNQDVHDGMEVGRILTQVIPAGSRVLIDTYGYGYAVELGAGKHDIFFDFTDPDYDAAVANPPAYVDYVLVPTTYQRGSFYTINQKHKKLHDEGATWAEFVDVLPATVTDWKLYKVKH